MSDNFFEQLGKGLSSPFMTKRKSLVDPYIKGLDKYEGRRLHKSDVDIWKTSSIGDGILSNGAISEAINADIYSSVSGGGTYSSDVDANIVNVNDTLTVDGVDVGATLKTLQERFLILEEDFKKHEQYPALKDAYEKYKLIETLLKENK